MITAIYFAATPNIQCKQFYSKISPPIDVGTAVKYRLTLGDDTHWLMYVFPSGG